MEHCNYLFRPYCPALRPPRLLEQVANWLSFPEGFRADVMDTYKREILRGACLCCVCISQNKKSFSGEHVRRGGNFNILGSPCMPASVACTVGGPNSAAPGEAWTEIANSTKEWHLLVEDDVAFLQLLWLRYAQVRQQGRVGHASFESCTLVQRQRPRASKLK